MYVCDAAGAAASNRGAGDTITSIAPLVGELADTLGRTIDVALQDRPPGTGHAVLCGLSALPDDYAGNVVVTSEIPLLDADTLADLIATHRGAVSAAVTVRLTRWMIPSATAASCAPRDHEVMAIGANRRDTIAAGNLRSQRRRARHRRAAVRTEPAELQQRPTGALPRRHRYLAPDGQTVHASHVDDGALVAGVNNRVRPSWPPNSTGGWWPLTSWPASLSSTRLPPGSTSTSPSHATPSFTRVPSCYRTQIGGRCVGPDTTLTDVAVATVLGGAHPRLVVVDKMAPAVGPFTYQARNRWAPTALGAFVRVIKNLNTVPARPHLTASATPTSASTATSAPPA